MRAIVLTIIAGFLVGFFAIEVYLRFDDHSSLAVDYAYHEWDGRERRVMATADELRDPRKAIVVLGDSMVAGVNCGREQNLVGYFASAMQPLAADYKAINLGSANTSVFAYLDQLEGYETAVGTPAGIVVILYTNDADVIEPRMCPVADVIERSTSVTPDEKAEIRAFCDSVTPGAPPPAGSARWFSIGGPVDVWLYGYSYAYRFFRESSAVLAASFGAGEPIGRLRYPELWTDTDGLTFRLITLGLEAIKGHADRDGVPMMVAFYPPVEFLAEDNIMYAATEAAGRVLEQRLNVPVLNGFHAYLDDPRASRNMSWSLTDHHPSCLGHQIFAEWLVEKFEAFGGFEGGTLVAEPASSRESEASMARSLDDEPIDNLEQP